MGLVLEDLKRDRIAQGLPPEEETADPEYIPVAPSSVSLYRQLIVLMNLGRLAEWDRSSLWPPHVGSRLCRAIASIEATGKVKQDPCSNMIPWRPEKREQFPLACQILWRQAQENKQTNYLPVIEKILQAAATEYGVGVN